MRIVANRLGKSYLQKRSKDTLVAIDSIDLTIDSGEIVSIVGKTGCGKSTFFDLLLGLESPTQGELTIDGRSPSKEFWSFRGQVGVVFQEDRLIPWRTTVENAELGLQILGYSRTERRERARGWLSRVGLAAFEDAYPGELSGGMKQRTSMARAFALEPKLILADESFGHLDEVTAVELRSEFLALVEQLQATAVFITHQLDEALDVAHRTIVFGRPGRVLLDVDVTSMDASARAAVRREIQSAISHDHGSLA